MKRTLWILLTLAALAWVIRSLLESSKSYQADTIETPDALSAEALKVPDDAPTPDFDKHAPREKAPSWIQGTWHVDTDYGGITLKIRNQSIAETSGGKTSYGHFKYQNNCLYCDFGDNTVFVYRLNEEKQQIDAGSGMLMRKLE